MQRVGRHQCRKKTFFIQKRFCLFATLSEKDIKRDFFHKIPTLCIQPTPNMVEVTARASTNTTSKVISNFDNHPKDQGNCMSPLGLEELVYQWEPSNDSALTITITYCRIKWREKLFDNLNA